MVVRIGTRGSRLALWQAKFVAERLRAAAGSLEVELVEIETAGDRDRQQPLASIGGDGVFTKEIQRALLDGAVDVAVHSLKDLPTLPVEGLTLAAVPSRGPIGDVLVAPKHRTFDQLPQGACIGTSSLRRRAQALHRRPDLRLVDLRGNIETRLQKLTHLGWDAIILAEAGLQRLGLGSTITEVLSPEWMLPAIGQGALGLECRADDLEALNLVRHLDHRPTRQAVIAERSFLWTLGGGCLVPIGAFTEISGEKLTLRGAVLGADGSRRIAGAVECSLDDATDAGSRLARELLAAGAGALLDAVESVPDESEPNDPGTI